MAKTENRPDLPGSVDSREIRIGVRLDPDIVIEERCSVAALTGPVFNQQTVTNMDGLPRHRFQAA